MSEFEVEVVFALPDRQSLIRVSVRSGDTLAEVVLKSGLGELFAGHAIDNLPIGIWGQEAQNSQLVKEGDRIEIYRPLELNPREARRQLALVGRTMGSADSH